MGVGTWGIALVARVGVSKGLAVGDMLRWCSDSSVGLIVFMGSSLPNFISGVFHLQLGLL